MAQFTRLGLGGYAVGALAFPAGATVDLVGNLAPSVSFAGALTAVRGLQGNLAPVISFHGDLTTTTPGTFVDLAGNLAPSVALAADISVAVVPSTGSRYGVGPYGRGLYSRSSTFALVAGMTPVVTFGGDLTIVGIADFRGDLKPLVSFHGDLAVTHSLAGDLAPRVTFAGSLSVILGLKGDLAPHVVFGGALSKDVPLGAGTIPATVTLSGDLSSGPLWQEEPPPPSLWTPTDPCLSPWVPADACPPVAWNKSEPCRG